MFFDFHQNNSGGGFDYDEEAGISTVVVIEAESADEANDRARRIGLYFDGVETDRDCSCCGDRWSEVWRSEGAEAPSVYGTPVSAYKPIIKWQGDGTPEIFVHYADGRITGYGTRAKSER